VKGAYLLLPPDSKIIDVTIATSNKATILLDNLVLPSSSPVPTSSYQTPLTPQPDPQIYSHEGVYPYELYTHIGTYLLRGYQVAVFRLHPVHYEPKENVLHYYSMMKLTVSVETTYQQSPYYRGIVQDKTLIDQKVDNSWMAEHWYSFEPIVFEDPYDLLILTTDEFSQGFEPLRDIHGQQGIRTRIKTLKDISFIPGQITSESIRSFIKDEYIEHGIQYVLLGGDSDIIPARMLYVYGKDEERWPMDTILPADFYYGCLDGPFNNDGDDRWGEPHDGKDDGDVDLFAEVFVGRACVDTTRDVGYFVNKTISYLTMDHTEEYLSNVLLVGEILGDYGVASYGGNYLDLLIDGSDLDGYQTVGIPSNRFSIQTLYDRDHPNGSWKNTELVDLINQGVHILNHDGHSYYGYNMKMTNSDVSYLQNEHPFFDYSVGCMAGGFDDPEGYDCFAEYLTVKTEHGCFASIMNARYGFFWSFSTDGDGTRFQREFWDAVFGEQILALGKAHQDAKEDNIYLIDRSCMRWTYYGLNLFGDPSVPFIVSAPPEKPTIQGPTYGNPGTEYTYTISCTDPEQEPVQYHIEFEPGKGYWTDTFFDSGETIDINWVWEHQGSYVVRLKARDVHGMESAWSTLEVAMPRYKASWWFLQLFEYSPFTYLFERLQQYGLFP
ncbi:MAG: C25 family cysteine peptidase, partial [Candidatus Thermoplasmatota archaeon]|nr:C25 family cysteine peptidase [Candidatus Thermoplasmatota archaeon]